MNRGLPAILLLAALTARAEDVTRIGETEFLRDKDAAFARAKEEGKLVLLWRLLGSLDGAC